MQAKDQLGHHQSKRPELYLHYGLRGNEVARGKCVEAVVLEPNQSALSFLDLVKTTRARVQPVLSDNRESSEAD